MTKASDWRAYAGYYTMPHLVVRLKEVDGRLALALPGVPDGYEMLLAPQGDDVFVLQRGPLAGMPVAFQRNAAGVVSGARVGAFELARQAERPAAAWQASERLAAPPLRLDEAKQAAFATLWQAVKAAGDGRYIDYTLPYPKHEFLRYVGQLDEVIFHGSNNADIAEFRPVRTSYELRDSTGRGNLQAVYGTHDGIWAMFFAIIDRQRLVGSINNGVMYFENAAGETLAMYNFSVSEQSLAERPWCAGTMYLLPRDTFVRLELGNGVPANEWASETAVRPLARLALQPEDFPFLTDIRGHDDGQLIRFNELSRVVLAAATGAAEPQPDVFRLTLDWRAELGPALLEYVALLREFVPTVRLALQFEPENGPVRLEIGGPPAFAQVLRGRLGEKLGVSREP